MKKIVTKALLKSTYIELEATSILVKNLGDFCLVKLYGQSSIVEKKVLQKLIKHRKLAIVAI